jgi:hypothetical protein
MFLDEYPDIPYSTLSYTCGECNYGGKVTDAHDRHTLMTILESYYTPQAVSQDSFQLSISGKYIIPPSTNHQVCMPRKHICLSVASLLLTTVWNYTIASSSLGA